MTSLSTVSSASSGWSNAMPPRPPGGGRLAERLFSQFDADNSGSVDSTELQNLLSDVSQKTGLNTSSTSASDLLSASDSNGDGSLSASELGDALKSVLPPPPSTLDFVQSRSSAGSASSATTATGQAGDDLFSQLDTNGDSSVSQDELQSLLDQMASDQGNSSSALNAADVISQLDTNGDGSLSASELDAARPKGQEGPPPGDMPPPPPPLTDSSLNSSNLVTSTSTSTSSTDSTSTSGTSEDPLQALFNAIDSDQSGDISSSEAQTFLSQLASQLDSTTGATGTGSSSSGNSSNTDSDSSTSSQDLVQLVQAARREYQAHMHGWNAIGSQLSASA